MRRRINTYEDNSRAYGSDPEAGFYKEFEKKCTECGNDFTTSVPASWFNGNGELDKNKIINSRTVEEVQQSIKDTVCQGCKQKYKIKSCRTADE